MEPVSIVSAAAGAIGFALKTSQALYELIDGTIDAPKDVFAVSSEVKMFTYVLASLQALINDGKVQEEAESNLEVPLNNCIKTLTSLTVKIQPYIQPSGDANKSKWKGLMWTFKKGETKALCDQLARGGVALIAAVGIMNTNKLDANSVAVGANINLLRREIKARDSDKVMFASISGRRGSESHEIDAGFALRRYLENESVIGSNTESFSRAPSDTPYSTNDSEMEGGELQDDPKLDQTKPSAAPDSEPATQQNYDGPVPELDMVANRLGSSSISSPESTVLYHRVGDIQSPVPEKNVLGQDDRHVLRRIAKQASEYEKQERWEEAEKLWLQRVEISKRMLGPEHPGTLKAMHDLAKTYHSQERWQEAEELWVQVIEIRKRVLGLEHPDTLNTMAYLALTYYSQERWQEAEELEVQVIEMRKRVLGLEHSDTLNAMANLASTCHSQKRWQEAEKLWVQVIEIRKRVLGLEHPDTLVTMHNLALIYYYQNQWQEAEELEVQVIEIRKRVLGLEHPDTLVTMANLASTYHFQERWQEAEELEVQVIEISKRVLGPEHSDTLNTMANLASTYHFQERWQEAEELLVQVIEISKRVLGPEHSETLTTMEDLVSTYYFQKRWKEAEDLLVQVMDIRKRVLGPEHPDTLESEGKVAFLRKL